MSDRMSDDRSPVVEGESSLRRSLGPLSLLFFGVGGMLGAGIYALVGNAAAILGPAVWMGFAVAMVAALLTGLSYANIGSRYPRAAGAAYATHRAYGVAPLTYIVGLAVIASGLTSMATGTRAIGRELNRIGWQVNPEVVGIAYLIVLAGVVFWGIREAMAMNVVCTIIEVLGLALIIFIGFRFIGSVDLLQGPPDPAGRIMPIELGMVVGGAVLSFFAFIGFEDMLNVSEECRNPRRDIPIGLIGAMLIATTLYMLVAVIAVSAVPHSALVADGLRAVLAHGPSWAPDLFSYILLFAVANTALLNFVMASRLVYGMSRQGLLPRSLGAVHPHTRTPWAAILLLLAIIVALMLSGQITELAAATVLLLLTVFTIVNAALVVLKLRKTQEPGRFEVPIIVPALGAIVCAALVVIRVIQPPADGRNAAWIALGVVIVAGLLYAVLRPKAVEQA